MEEIYTLEEKMRLCQERTGHTFQDLAILKAALTHASGATTRLQSNERMEFLGDAILGYVICERLFRLFPDSLEGDLTKVKSVVVSRRVCASVAKQMGLEDCLILGKGMLKTGGVPRSLLSDVFEALIAAIYLDAGMEAARSFVLRSMHAEISLAVEGYASGNYKSALQQLAQRDLGGTPVYRMVSERGPDHSKSFLIMADINGKTFTPAWGRNKKDAEQRAAGNALAELRGDSPIYSP